jgi:CO/xanthine dehydrogenase FAD-binding subunit
MGYFRPTSVTEALDTYARHPDAIPLAGGTDVMVSWNAGQLNDRGFLDLSRLTAWSSIRATSGGLTIGALVDHTRVHTHAVVRREFPLLAEACRTVGGIQIQNRGTLGGNIANASPAGDTFPALAVYGAEVRLASKGGRRTLPVLDVFEGVKRTALAPSELIRAVALPFTASTPTRQLFRKVGTRAAQAISKTVAAGLLWTHPDGRVRDLRFALGSMAPTVRRLRTVEASVRGRRLTARVVDEACERLGEDVSPIDDLRSTREYRMDVSRNILRSFLEGRHG